MLSQVRSLASLLPYCTRASQPVVSLVVFAGCCLQLAKCTANPMRRLRTLRCALRTLVRPCSALPMRLPACMIHGPFIGATRASPSSSSALPLGTETRPDHRVYSCALRGSRRLSVAPGEPLGADRYSSSSSQVGFCFEKMK